MPDPTPPLPRPGAAFLASALPNVGAVSTARGMFANPSPAIPRENPGGRERGRLLIFCDPQQSWSPLST